MEKTKSDGMWITEDFGTKFKLMTGLGQVLGYFDSYDQAAKRREEINGTDND